MRRVWLPGALCLILGSSLSATTVSGCLLDLGPTTCYSTGTFSFADSLDWGAAVNLAGTGQSGFGSALNPGNPANPHDVGVLPWIARSVGNVNIFASLATSGSTPVLTRVDNTFWGYGPVLTSDGIINQFAPPDQFLTSPNHLVTFAGHFANNPTSPDQTQTQIGEHLLGNISGNGNVVLGFNHAVSQIGFKIAANSTSSNTNFTATIIAFNGSTIVHTYSIVVVGGGGICDSLKPAFPNEGTPPVPCNDAAFIAMDAGPQRFNSIQVFTSNLTGGFFINGLQFNADAAEVPEPGMTLLMAGGLAGLWLFSTARRRFAGTR